MNYLAIKDLKASKLVRETLAAYGTALITNNGKPMAMLIDLAEDENPEQLAHAIRLARARLALSEIRTASRRSSTHKLSRAHGSRRIQTKSSFCGTATVSVPPPSLAVPRPPMTVARVAPETSPSRSSAYSGRSFNSRKSSA